MISKILPCCAEAIAPIQDGAHIAIGGFGGAGMPEALIGALLEKGTRDLTVITNNAGQGDTGIAALLNARRVRKIVCSYPRMAGAHVFEALYRQRAIELELVPQGTLAERLRAAGVGLGGFFTPTSYGTLLAKGKETRELNGRHYVFETPLFVDFALIHAQAGDRWGNLVYRNTARNFGPVMAMAARHTIATVSEIRELGGLNPEAIVTPGIFVDAIVLRTESGADSLEASRPALTTE
ncbi:3-oxoacid CoA-transferase subunit A [Pandoraea terrigena]|uniref:3-oxoadipate CoA-transferase n=1 Tax=Pandoraea terrigena TaxID=2508292 RepID=A0A5E4WND9_9BURK|nr:3-oxoacid CoA-transferase subunit A [Pandoraea terrigena]VVE25663.1 3-oxoadipate CoA-transferase [Pandoraea terrigena]